MYSLNQGRRAVIVIALMLGLLSPDEVKAFGDPVRCNFGKDGVFQSAKEYKIFVYHQQVDEFKYFDKNCDGIISPDERAAYLAALDEEFGKGAEHEFTRNAHHNLRIAVAKDKPPKPEKTYGGWYSQIILRDSFEDISVWSRPKDLKDAAGATFSYARDQEAHNSVWTAKGVVAYPISWSNPDNPEPRSLVDPYLVGFAFSPTITFDKVSNSSKAIAKKSDVDILTFGGGGEAAIGHVFESTHYFRLRGNIATNFEGDTRSRNLIVEYQPITGFDNGFDLGTRNPVGSLPLTFRLDAILRAREAERVGSTIKDPLFDFGDHVFRVGPVLALSINPLKGPTSPVPEWLQSASFYATYSLLRDLHNRLSYEHYMAALAFALDKDDHLAVRLSYEKGKVEETGQPVDLTKVGLSAKW